MAQTEPLKQVTIHTDGGCDGNPGPGGWAAVLRYGSHVKELSGAEPATTNNRMELMAAIAALDALTQPCTVTLHTDSQYLRRGVTEWLARWKSNGWRTVERQPVKNDDLWRRLDSLTSRHRITWRWVKGHAGHRDNERCDQLAGAAIAKLRKAYSKSQLEGLRRVFDSERDPAKGQTTLPLEGRRNLS